MTQHIRQLPQCKPFRPDRQSQLSFPTQVIRLYAAREMVWYHVRNESRQILIPEGTEDLSPNLRRVYLARLDQLASQTRSIYFMEKNNQKENRLGKPDLSTANNQLKLLDREIVDTLDGLAAVIFISAILSTNELSNPLTK